MSAILLLSVFLDFNSSQTTSICSQQSGTFSMQSFWIDQFINLLLYIYMFLSRLDRILKNNFPSTFQRDIGLKSLMLFGFGLPDLGDILFVCIWFEHILTFLMLLPFLSYVRTHVGTLKKIKFRTCINITIILFINIICYTIYYILYTYILIDT